MPNNIKPEDEDENDSTCPPIEVGLHQNSFNPPKIEKRGSIEDE